MVKPEKSKNQPGLVENKNPETDSSRILIILLLNSPVYRF